MITWTFSDFLELIMDGWDKQINKGITTTWYFLTFCNTRWDDKSSI